GSKPAIKQDKENSDAKIVENVSKNCKRLPNRRSSLVNRVSDYAFICIILITVKTNENVLQTAFELLLLEKYCLSELHLVVDLTKERFEKRRSLRRANKNVLQTAFELLLPEKPCLSELCLVVDPTKE
ncbi:20851_t:CDS:2, partial [Gigaspora rosea]